MPKRREDLKLSDINSTIFPEMTGKLKKAASNNIDHTWTMFL